MTVLGEGLAQRRSYRSLRQRRALQLMQRLLPPCRSGAKACLARVNPFALSTLRRRLSIGSHIGVKIDRCRMNGVTPNLPSLLRTVERDGLGVVSHGSLAGCVCRGGQECPRVRNG